MKIGLIGCGTVGGAVLAAYNNIACSVRCADVNDDIAALRECDLIWVCIPESEISGVARKCHGWQALIVLKSTALPSQFQGKFGRLVYAPEFLTQHNANADFFNPPLLPIGADTLKDFETVVGELVKLGVNVSHATWTTPQEASLIKYYANAFLATKVIFNHQYKLFCDNIGVDYDKIASVCSADPRLGTSHWSAPGEHGYGYSGKCFPKDVKALVNNSDSLTLLKAVDQCNLELQYFTRQPQVSLYSGAKGR